MVEPDQPEAERVVGRKRILGRADGRNPGLPAPQQGSRKAGRQSVLQVLLSAQFGEPVSGELPLQGAAKPLAILQPRAAPVGIPIRRIGQIEQRQSACQFAEPVNLDLQPSTAFATNAAYSSDKI